MANNEELYALADSALCKDRKRVVAYIKCIVANAKEKSRGKALAGRLESLLRLHGCAGDEIDDFSPRHPAREFVQITTPQREMGSMVLPQHVVEECEALCQEQDFAADLAKVGLRPRRSIFLVGPPGNGKTELAKVLASMRNIPLVSVEYHAVFGSFLGETGSRLAKVFDLASETPCVLFFDEFETLARERAEKDDNGETKRVVSSLLLQLDALPSHCIVVVASNHPEMIDRAAWRRFDLRMDLPDPDVMQIEQFISMHRASDLVELNVHNEAQALSGNNFGDIEKLLDQAARVAVINGQTALSPEQYSQVKQHWELRAKCGAPSNQ